MGFRINTNVAALNAHTAATMNNRNLDNSLAKLSSGLRINKAADDASGLAIANALKSQASSLGQAVSNGNDAIGLIQTADGALSEYSNILDTIKTKAVQAASDGQNTNSRLAIQKDIDALMEELNIIAKTTSFNGQKLLSGTFVNKEFQMGASANESVKVNIASAQTNQIGQTSRATMEVGTSAGGEVQLNITSAKTGKELTLKTIDLQFNNETQNGMGALADEINRYSGETGISAKAVVEATASSAVASGSTGSDFSINGIVIGAVNVAQNDNDGTLVNAINSKSTQTGVSATISSDGKLTLQSDGRAMKIEGTGDTANVLGDNVKNMSTLGNIELVQSGSSEFQITGNGAGATGLDINVSGTVTTTVDSSLAAGSTIAVSSTIKAGSTVGGNMTLDAAYVQTQDAVLAVGSTIEDSSIFKAGTELGGQIQAETGTNITLTQDMFVAGGSTLGTGTVLGVGTIIGEDFSVGATNYSKGDVLTSTVALTSGLAISEDWTLNYNGATGNSVLAEESILAAGTILGGDVQTTGTSTVTVDMTVKNGSTLATGTILNAGSVVGGDSNAASTFTTSMDSIIKNGSTLGSSTILKEGSTVGAAVAIAADKALNADMTLKAGSVLATGTIIKAGTIINQDMKLASAAASAASVDVKAGSTLTSDMYVGNTAAGADKITLSDDMILLKGTGTTLGTLGASSSIAVNTESSGGTKLSESEFTNLSNVDVTTLDGAMKAIDTLGAAITNLDSIRSDLGSAQNQIVSTINNISVTQVNVKAAESNIRDVDFAAESAAFSKFNILAQSGSYAMSQANAVQQNVLRLLQ